MIEGKKTEAQYRAVDMDSSSSLKEFSMDMRKYRKKYILKENLVEEEDSKASVIGRLVETLLFESDEFDKRFYMSSTAVAPTGNMALFVEALYKRTSEAVDEAGNVNKTFEEIAKEAHKDSGYKWTLEKVLEKFIGTDNEIYYKEIREVRTKGLTVVTADDVANAEKIKQELLTNEFTSGILSLTNSSRYEILHQYKIEGYEVDGMKLKSMMDIVIIDHKEKSIQFYDLKCVWAVEGFYTEYYLYRRAYIQAYLYKQACHELKKRKELDLYTVKNPKFIVCDSINYYNPLIYALDGDDMDDAYFGFEANGRKYPGVKEIIANLKWAKENDKWTISKINYLNNGEVNIKR